MNFADSEHLRQSVDDSLPNLVKVDQDIEIKNPLENAESNSFRITLPDDEDELLAGLTDDFDLSRLPSHLEEMEEYDLFGSGGGMELDFESQDSLGIGLSKLSISDGVSPNGIGHYALPNGAGTVAGEHPYGEHPSRTLFVRNINSNVEDSELRSLFEVFCVAISFNFLVDLASLPGLVSFMSSFSMYSGGSGLLLGGELQLRTHCYR